MDGFSLFFAKKSESVDKNSFTFLFFLNFTGTQMETNENNTEFLCYTILFLDGLPQGFVQVKSGNPQRMVLV